MPYLIDGHNLIGQLPDISLTDPDDEARLVEKVRSFCARTGKKAHIVFDHGLPGGKSKMSNNAVKVFFASRPGEADDLMLSRIQKIEDSKGWYVVSSDERVLTAAKRRGMETLRSIEFARKLQAPPPIPKDENPHVYVSPDEVNEWLEIFNNQKRG